MLVIPALFMAFTAAASPAAPPGAAAGAVFFLAQARDQSQHGGNEKDDNKYDIAHGMKYFEVN